MQTGLPRQLQHAEYAIKTQNKELLLSAVLQQFDMSVNLIEAIERSASW